MCIEAKGSRNTEIEFNADQQNRNIFTYVNKDKKSKNANFQSHLTQLTVTDIIYLTL